MHPSPPTVPIGRLWLQPPGNDCELLQLYAKYGPVVKTTPFYQQYLVNEPQAICQVLSNPEQYDKTRVAIRRLGDMVGEGLITHAGQAWQQAKQRLHGALHPSKYSTLPKKFHHMTHKHLAKWCRPGPLVASDITPLCLALAFELNVYALTGMDFTDNSLQYIKTITKAIHVGTRAWSLKAGSLSLRRLRFEQLAKPLHQWADQLVDDMIDQQNPHALLSPLIQCYHAGEINRSALIGEFKTFLFAGYEATGIALTWLLYHVSQHPTINESMRQEYLNTITSDTDLNLEKFHQLHITQSVISETLRLSPSVFVMERRTKKACIIHGYHVPADALLVISPYLIQRHAKYWPEPNVFNPNRFKQATATKPIKGSYLPFGLGPRSCIGLQLSQIMLKSMLSCLIPNIDFHCITIRPNLGYGQITLKPSSGIWMKIKKRP